MLFGAYQALVSFGLLGILTTQKKLIGGVLGLVPVAVAKFGKKLKESALIRRRYLQTNQNAPVVRTMIAVVKE